MVIFSPNISPTFSPVWRKQCKQINGMHQFPALIIGNIGLSWVWAPDRYSADEVEINEMDLSTVSSTVTK